MTIKVSTNTTHRLVHAAWALIERTLHFQMMDKNKIRVMSVSRLTLKTLCLSRSLRDDNTTPVIKFMKSQDHNVKLALEISIGKNVLSNCLKKCDSWKAGISWEPLFWLPKLKMSVNSSLKSPVRLELNFYQARVMLMKLNPLWWCGVNSQCV